MQSLFYPILQLAEPLVFDNFPAWWLYISKIFAKLTVKANAEFLY